MPGQRLEAFAALDEAAFAEAAFAEEVRRRRPKAAGKLTPAALRALRDGYAEQATPVRQRQAEALGLERRLADLVNQAYGLTPEDVELLWRTAPPRYLWVERYRDEAAEQAHGDAPYFAEAISKMQDPAWWAKPGEVLTLTQVVPQ